MTVTLDIRRPDRLTGVEMDHIVEQNVSVPTPGSGLVTDRAVLSTKRQHLLITRNFGDLPPSTDSFGSPHVIADGRDGFPIDLAPISEKVSNRRHRRRNRDQADEIPDVVTSSSRCDPEGGRVHCSDWGLPYPFDGKVNSALSEASTDLFNIGFLSFQKSAVEPAKCTTSSVDALPSYPSPGEGQIVVNSSVVTERFHRDNCMKESGSYGSAVEVEIMEIQSSQEGGDSSSTYLKRAYLDLSIIRENSLCFKKIWKTNHCDIVSNCVIASRTENCQKEELALGSVPEDFFCDGVKKPHLHHHWPVHKSRSDPGVSSCCSITSTTDSGLSIGGTRPEDTVGKSALGMFAGPDLGGGRTSNIARYASLPDSGFSVTVGGITLGETRSETNNVSSAATSDQIDSNGQPFSDAFSRRASTSDVSVEPDDGEIEESCANLNCGFLIDRSLTTPTLKWSRLGTIAAMPVYRRTGRNVKWDPDLSVILKSDNEASSGQDLFDLRAEVSASSMPTAMELPANQHPDNNLPRVSDTKMLNITHTF